MKIMKMMGAAGLLAGMMMVSGCGSDDGIAFIMPFADLTITKSHVGDFRQNQAGAVYTVTVKNVGAAATNKDKAVTVTDTLPAGLTATALAGTGWTCDLGTVTCTRSDELAAGASYPAITVTVKVASTAGSPLTNTVTVSGGGDAILTNNSASNDAVIENMTVSVSAPNTTAFDAAVIAPKDTYRFELHAASKYTYLINGFAAGDILQFDAGSAITVTNTSASDRVIDVIGSLGGNDVTVHLTGIAPASDAQVFNPASFRAVFGADSLNP